LGSVSPVGTLAVVELRVPIQVDLELVKRPVEDLAESDGADLALKLLRNIWLILGVSLSLFVLLESSLSAAFLLKDSLFRSGPQPVDPKSRADAYREPG